MSAMAEKFSYPLQFLVLSHSTSSTYHSCARKLEFKKFYGVQKVELDDFGFPRENFEADVGSALHVGSQDYFVNMDEDQAIYKMAMEYPIRAEMSQPNSYRSLEAAYATLMAIIRSPIVNRYEIIQIAVKQADGSVINRPAVEVPYVIEITGSPLQIPVFHVGLIDAIFFDKVENKYIVVDIKTHRDNTSDLSLRYEYDEQTIPYGLILEHILGHSITEFVTGYLSCYVDMSDPKVRLYEFNKSQDHIKDWFIGQCTDIKHIATYMKNQWFPRATNGATCMAFRRRCSFAEICAYRDPIALSRMIEGEPRDTLFHDGKEPWISVQIPYVEMEGV